MIERKQSVPADCCCLHKSHCMYKLLPLYWREQSVCLTEALILQNYQSKFMTHKLWVILGDASRTRPYYENAHFDPLVPRFTWWLELENLILIHLSRTDLGATIILLHFRLIRNPFFLSLIVFNMIMCQYQLLLHFQIHQKANCILDSIVGKWIKSKSREATYWWIKNGSLVQSSIFAFRWGQNCKF